jgi:hypothetical protein
MQKMALNNQEPDDLITKEFLNKYNKEFHYIVKFYENEKKKRDFLKEKALKAISTNTKVIEKIQQVIFQIILD